MKSNSSEQSEPNQHPSSAITLKKVLSIGLAILVFIVLMVGLPDVFDYSARLMTAIVCFGVILWALEPIPLGLTAVIVLLLMLLFNAADTQMIFSGFASPAIYLIVAGMMLARAVNTTPLVKRMTYKLLQKWGSTSKGLLGSILVILQIQALFIPATAVRTMLMLPITSMIIKTVGAKPGSNLRKMILVAIAFGGTISGTAVMTAAIGNILTVELLYRYADIKITYFQWFLYTFPLWLLLVPAIWVLLIKVYPLPKEQQSFPMVKKEMDAKIQELGPIGKKEIRCLVILFFIVGLWLTEPFHGLHPSIPALIGVALMCLPGIGCAVWEDVVKINYNTILLVSLTLSMGYTFVDSGSANIISDYLSADWILSLIQRPFLAIILVVFLAQLWHKLLSNVSTAVVTLVPIVINIANNANVDPMIFGFTAGLTSLYGFILVVETMPNLLIHSTGMITQRDFITVGFYTTILTSVFTIIIAFTWWKVIGLL